MTGSAMLYRVPYDARAFERSLPNFWSPLGTSECSTANSAERTYDVRAMGKDIPSMLDEEARLRAELWWSMLLILKCDALSNKKLVSYYIDNDKA